MALKKFQLAPTRVILIVPCFNEKERLNLGAFHRKDYIDYLFVDDGSQDNTCSVLRSQGFEVISNFTNQGKGPSIYNAYHHIKSTRDIGNYDWIGYWDADLAVPLDFVGDMVAKAEGTSADALWASRALSLKTPSLRIRSIFSRCFAILVRKLFGTKIQDTQCGAKLFTPACAEVAFSSHFLSRWLFDIEILKRIEQTFRILECELDKIHRNDRSRISLFQEVVPTCRDIAEIFKIYGR